MPEKNLTTNELIKELEKRKQEIKAYDEKAKATSDFLKNEIIMATNILLVDDENSIRQPYSLALKDKGYNVFTAENGQEALDIVSSYDNALNKIHATLVDNHMPVMSGEEFVKNIRQNPFYKDYSSMKIISIGATPSKENQAMYDAFLNKPLELDEIYSTLEKVLLE